jgi:RecG-like helicase
MKMTKLDVLKATAETVHAQYEEAHNEIKAVFAPMKKSMTEENTEIEIFARSSWDREIGLRISNKDVQWCSETIRIDLKPNKDEKCYDLSFSHGSGGWQEDVCPQRALMYMEDACRATRLAQTLANDSIVTLDCAMDKFFAIGEVLSDIQREIREIRDAEKEEAANVMRENIMKQLPFNKAKTGSAYLAELTDGLDNDYRCVRLVYVSIDIDGNVRFHKKELSAEKYKKTVFKIDYSRVSRAVLENETFKGYVEIPQEMWYASVLSNYKTTVEEVLKNIESFNAQREA